MSDWRGDVERPRGGDAPCLKHCELAACSQAINGGLDLGVMEALGGTVAWHAEFEGAPSRILAHHWPDVPNLGDVTAVDWSTVEPVDVICGGSPCQDVSMAGARKGMRAGTRSGLWASMCDAIDIIRPSLVIWENVRGALSAGADSRMEPCDLGMGCEGPVSLRALGRVLGDLAELGYDAGWEVVRASDIGAPHRRERVFVVAHSGGSRGHQAIEHDGRGAEAGDRAGVPHEPDRHAHGPGPVGALSLLPTPDAYSADRGGPQHPDKRRAGGHSVTIADAVSALRLLPTPKATNNENRPSPGFDNNGEMFHYIIREERWCNYTPAIVRWEAVLGRTAPAPTEPNAAGNQRLSARFVEWMMGLPEGHVVDVPGITRNQALKALGNGVVPQQAAHAIRRILAAQEVAA